jgi:hypothetical protein
MNLQPCGICTLNKIQILLYNPPHKKPAEFFMVDNEDTFWIGKVQYLDFSRDWMGEWKDVFQAFQ